MVRDIFGNTFLDYFTLCFFFFFYMLGNSTAGVILLMFACLQVKTGATGWGSFTDESGARVQAWFDFELFCAQDTRVQGNVRRRPGRGRPAGVGRRPGGLADDELSGQCK